MSENLYPLIHPREILMKEFLEPVGITQHKLAVPNKVPPRRRNAIVHGNRRISVEPRSG